MKARAGSRLGKCHNYSGCLLAYRGEQTEIEDPQPFVCPECGKPLDEVKPSMGPFIWLISALVLLVIVGIGVMAVWPVLNPKATKKPATEETTPAPSTPAEKPGTPAPRPPIGIEPVSAEPPKAVVIPDKIDLDVSKGENRKVKDDVLTRVDLMPITEKNKDKLYSSVERARQMGKILTIPFASGKIDLSPADIEAIKTEIDKPELMKLRDDPTAVFVILGFADPKGDAKKNVQISQQRADAVLAAMRDKCGVFNVLHSVAMGGSTLLDAQNLEKNRIVEVWTVLP